MAWKPRARSYDLRQISNKLEILKSGSRYNSDLSAGPMDHKIIPETSDFSKYAKDSADVIMSMPLTFRTKRDYMIDEENPRDELPKYTKGVDQVPPFDRAALTAIAPYDGVARQQVELVIAGRQSYAREENKYDSSFERNENQLDPKIDAGGNPTDAQRRTDWQTEVAKRAELRKQEEVRRAEIQDQSGVL